MKRLVILAVAALALAIPALATASHHDDGTLSLTASPTTVVTGDMLTLSGSLLDERHHGIGNEKVFISTYAGGSCHGWPLSLRDVRTSNWFFSRGDYSLARTANLEPGSYSFKATAYHDRDFLSSGCVRVTVTSDEVEVVPAPAPSNPDIFLCYSAYQTDPGVWAFSEAKDLFAAGYWQPFALHGNVPGGTNLGEFHLTCNLAAAQSVPDKHGYAGDGGEVYGADLHDAMATTLGFYPIIG